FPRAAPGDLGVERGTLDHGSRCWTAGRGTRSMAAATASSRVFEESTPVDMVTMNILESTMISICREMVITMMKTCYSTIFHEGLRVPPLKIVKAGKDVEEVWKLMLANVRTPRYNYGDMRALISSVTLGEQRLIEMIKKYGKDVFRQTCRDLMDYSEQRMRAEI